MDSVVPPLIFADAGFTLDISHSGVYAQALAELAPLLARAHRAQRAMERGEIADPANQRPITHVADRTTYEQTPVYADIRDFFERLRRGKFSGATGRPFAFVVINGIGGWTHAAQLLHTALHGTYWNERDKFERDNYPRLYFLDNTDPAGCQDLLHTLDLEATLVVSIALTDRTQELDNNLAALESAYHQAGIDFSKHACAVTLEQAPLDRHANDHNWLRIWLMSDTLCSRMCVTSVAGHVVAAATGIDFAAFLDGARMMDGWTRERDLFSNPAYLLAATWYCLGNGRGDKAMVVVPYTDRLPILGRYLQGLVMGSIGKQQNRAGEEVCQGLTVYGNKGASDTHAFVQQLQEGRNDFFVTFVEILRDADEYPAGNGLTMGDHLHAMLGGLMLSLYARDRSVTLISFDELDARAVGMLIALYERAVATYAELLDVNAYDHPGLKPYQRIARNINEINQTLQHFIRHHPGYVGTASEIAKAVQLDDWEEEVDGILAKFAVNLRTFDGIHIVRDLHGRRWRYTFAS